MPGHPPLPAHVDVVSGTRLGSLWRRYAIYDALHRGTDIWAPMSSRDLDRVVDGVFDAFDFADGARWLDIGCGHGELLRRASRRASISGVGIDESPWAITQAAARASALPGAAGLEWVVGDARAAALTEPFDIVACVGATHIWHGFAGTVAALVRWVEDGGRIVVGDLRPVVGGRDVQLRIFEQCGVEVLEEVVSDRHGWERYRSDVEQAVERWADDHPGVSGDEVRAVFHEWAAAHEQDAVRLEWAVWVGGAG